MFNLKDILENKEPIKDLKDLTKREGYKLIIYDIEAVLYLVFESFQKTNPYDETKTTIEKYFKKFERRLKRVLKERVENIIGYKNYYKIAVFGSEKNFRKQIDPNYKANRNQKSSNKTELKNIKKILKDLNMLIIESDEGYEADDWIASICKSLKEYSNEINIVTTDTDLLQLVKNNTNVLLLGLSMENYIICDYTSINNFHYYGLKPWHIAEAKALCGSINNNIRGILTFKEGNQLIRKFNSINEIYKNLDKIDNAAIKYKLINNKETAIRNLKLTTLKDNLINLNG